LSYKRKLSEREKKFIEELKKSNSVKEAMKKAGYSQSYAEKMSSWYMVRDRIRQALLQELESQGVTPAYLMKVTKEAMDECRKQKSSRHYAVLQRFMDMLIKLLGAYAPEKKEIRQENITITVDMDELVEAKKVIEAKIREKVKGKGASGG